MSETKPFDRHQPYDKIIPENPRVVEKLLAGEVVVENFYGQTHIFIPKFITETVGTKIILDFAQEIYGKEEYEKAGVPIVIIEGNYSHYMELPKCPVVRDEKDETNYKFDTIELDHFIERIKAKYAELKSEEPSEK